MAINLNLEKYGAQFNAFAEFAAAHKNQDWVVRIEGRGPQQGGQGLVGPHGDSRRIVAKNLDGAGNVLRFSGSRAVNNDVRSLFKETVLAVCGVRTMEELPPSVLAVMKKDDYDGKGHPLTVRRITAVTNAVLSEADKEAKSAAPQGKGGGGLPLSSVDVAVVRFKYAAPSFVAGFPSETAEKFMAFYCDAVDRSIANGQTKDDCDETFKEMFRAVGWDKNDRRLLAELLADGSPRFLDDGVLPYKADAVRFAEEFKAVLDKTKAYRSKLPKAFGDIVADTVLAALKLSDRLFDVDDLPLIDAEECEKIAKIAEEIDTEDLLSAPEDKVRSARSLSRKLAGFQQEASGKLAAALLRPNDTKLKVQVKQMLLMNLALSRAGAGADSLADEIEENYDHLVGRYGMKSLLDELAPALGRRGVPQGNE